MKPSAFCLEDGVLDNRNSVFLINPDNGQLIDALEYESDISVVLINLNGRFRCLT
jgi:S-adenosylmethionine hydrolase